MTSFDRVAAFLADRGHQLARGQLVRRGLPDDLADDVVQEALIRAHRAAERGEHLANPDAFATTIVIRAALDLIRGERRRPDGRFGAVALDDGDREPPELHTPGELDLGLVGNESARALRASATRALVRQPVPAAGALAVLTVVLDGAGAAADCPAPKAGAGDREALAWIGLFYAGEHHCFPLDGRAEDTAMRKRRSRAAQRQLAVLGDALADAGLTHGGATGG